MKVSCEIDELKRIAKELRVDILKMLNTAGSGHPGGSLSAIDILTALYCCKMNHDPGLDNGAERDRFVLSKGHGAPALYAVLARCGYFEKSHLNTLRKVGSILSGHPYGPLTPGVEVTTGSLGQGLSIANGMALGLRLDNRKGTVFCLLGDGEMQEGQVWEAAMSASHYKLDNVVAIVDNNGLQIDGEVKNVMGVEPIGDKWRSFGWEVFETDGHDMAALLDTFGKAVELKGKPALIWAHTVKGKGVSFMENQLGFHGVAPTDEELEKAILEINSV